MPYVPGLFRYSFVKKKRHSLEQIVKKLRDAVAMLAAIESCSLTSAYQKTFCQALKSRQFLNSLSVSRTFLQGDEVIGKTVAFVTRAVVVVWEIKSERIPQVSGQLQIGNVGVMSPIAEISYPPGSETSIRIGRPGKLFACEHDGHRNTGQNDVIDICGTIRVGIATDLDHRPPILTATSGIKIDRRDVHWDIRLFDSNDH